MSRMFEKIVEARLYLENGQFFTGKAFGHIAETSGEVVFTTSMTGYQEAMTDSAYAGQLVVMTYPLIGNYGTNLEDMESLYPKLNGLIVREKCAYPNNFRCEMELEGFLKQHQIVGLEGVDTRALTRVIRSQGIMRGILTTEELSEEQRKERFTARADYTGSDLVRKCTTRDKYSLPEINAAHGEAIHIAVLDLGVRRSVLRSFQKNGCRLTVFPAFAEAEDILAYQPDGVYISTGPGGTGGISYLRKTVHTLCEAKPVFASGLGFLAMAECYGGKTGKLQCGRHGVNYPVKDCGTGRILTTAQNQNYGLTDTPDGWMVTHRNIGDGSVQGIRHTQRPVSGVQFYPNEDLIQAFITDVNGAERAEEPSVPPACASGEVANHA